MTHDHHNQATAATDRPIRCAVLTISDTRTEPTDTSGGAIRGLLADAGHEVVEARIVPDEAVAIKEALQAWCGDQGVEVILSTGGTGLGRRDTTVGVVRKLLTREIEGFGELFRMISFEEVGSISMLSGAVGGLVERELDDGGDTYLFAMPGSTNAVRTAMTRLIVPELEHLVWERRR